MLTIRQSQLDDISRSMLGQFAERMIRRVEREHPDVYAARGEPAIRAYVLKSIEAAATLRIRTEGAVAGFILLRLEFGDNFDLQPDRVWALEILEHTALPDIVRISLIADRFEARTQGRKIVKVPLQEAK